MSAAVSAVEQDATLAPTSPQTGNRPAVRVLTSRMMAHPNNWKLSIWPMISILR